MKKSVSYWLPGPGFHSPPLWSSSEEPGLHFSSQCSPSCTQYSHHIPYWPPLLQSRQLSGNKNNILSQKTIMLYHHSWHLLMRCMVSSVILQQEHNFKSRDQQGTFCILWVYHLNFI